MAINVYPIAPSFPAGLNLDLLIQKMPSVWPPDLFPAEYIAHGKPGPTGVITAGALDIVTPRVLTAGEQADAEAHFLAHNPTDAVALGFLVAELPPPTPAMTVYVRDLARATGPGVGTMAYCNGTEWRRISDDAVV